MYDSIAGIDDSETECDLDDATAWDILINNDDDNSDIETILQQLLNLIR